MGQQYMYRQYVDGKDFGQMFGVILLLIASSLALLRWWWGRKAVKVERGTTTERLTCCTGTDSDTFDVVVAGAGPAGATCAFYLSKYSKDLFDGQGLRIALLDKAKFPRDKYCGDAWCAPALEILEEMGVLQELERDGLICNCLCGGFVSPAGHSFIANDRSTPDSEKNMSTRCYAIKRLIADERIARCAAKQRGVQLFEQARVESAELDPQTQSWTITCGDGRQFRARMLVAADGAASNIGRSLGLVQDPPHGIAARRYVKPGTHNFKADGVLLYPDYTLPGYAALFRHYDDSIDLGLYLLPGGAAKDSDLQEIYEKKLMTDPFVSRALGSKVEFSERLKVASLRLGGEKRSYGDQIVLVGDAAGQVDPLTGEGIHTGQIGGRIAAETIVEMFQQGNFSQAACKVYHDRWWNTFGKDFPVSSLAGALVYRAPFLMDAVPKASQAKGGKAGTAFFADFGAVMTGVLPKTTFLNPSVAFPLTVQTLKQFFSQHITRSERTYFTDPSSLLDVELKRSTSWDTQCLRDPYEPVRTNTSPSATYAHPVEAVFAHADDSLPSVLVLYGSEYGFSRMLAVELCQLIANTNRFSARCLSMEHYRLVDWGKENAAFFICSTAGDGDPPSDAQSMFDGLQEGTVQEMKDLFVSVLAPGDSAYPRFASAGKKLHELLVVNGCKSCVPLASLDGDDQADAAPWMQQCLVWLTSLASTLPLRSPAEEDDYLRATIRDNQSVFEKDVRGATREHPAIARVEEKRLLTAMKEGQQDEKETWHIELDISNVAEMLQYEPGDALGVQPQSDPADIEEILELVPASERARLRVELLHKDLKDSLRNLKQDPEEHVIDVLVRLQKQDSVGFDPTALLQSLKPLAPRYYSIASAPSLDKNRLHLCVAAVRYVSFGKKRNGVCSSFLIDRLACGDEVSVWIQRNNSFRPTSSAIMIGPGTGIAPFRSFLRAGLVDKQAMLFFGCRDESKDFLYKDELQSWSSSSSPTSRKQLIVAFSRSGPKKVYVQDRMHEAETAARVWEMLFDSATHVFICGEGQSMATDVKAALFDILQCHLPPSQTPEHFLKGRLHLDVW